MTLRADLQRLTQAALAGDRASLSTLALIVDCAVSSSVDDSHFSQILSKEALALVPSDEELEEVVDAIIDFIDAEPSSNHLDEVLFAIGKAPSSVRLISALTRLGDVLPDQGDDARYQFLIALENHLDDVPVPPELIERIREITSAAALSQSQRTCTVARRIATGLE